MAENVKRQGKENKAANNKVRRLKALKKTGSTLLEFNIKIL